MSTTLLLDLNKTFELNLDKAGISKTQIPTMEVRLAIDKSGSMDDEFRNGFVDKTVNLFLGVAMSFDDNGSVEVGFFNHSFHEAPEALPSDIGRYLAKSGQCADGGTAFADIIRAFETERGGVVAQATAAAKGFMSKLFDKKDAAPAATTVGAGCAVPGMRAYAAIITDGDNTDKREFEAELARTSGEVFYQFICIGNGAPTSYLERVAAQYPHVSVIQFRDPNRVTEDEFYQQIANPTLVEWIKG